MAFSIKILLNDSTGCPRNLAEYLTKSLELAMDKRSVNKFCDLDRALCKGPFVEKNLHRM